MRRWIAENWPDVLTGAGAIAVVRGVAMIHEPSAWITAGAGAIAVAFIAARAGRGRRAS